MGRRAVSSSAMSEVPCALRLLSLDVKRVAVMGVLVLKVGEGREQIDQVRCEVPSLCVCVCVCVCACVCVRHCITISGRQDCSSRDGRAGV